MINTRNFIRSARVLSCGLAIALLGACSVKSVDGIEYFSEVAAASAAKDCDTKPEANWKVASFKAEGVEFQLIGPLGVICGRDAAGALQKAYRTTPVGTATHRALYGTSFGIADTMVFERRDAGGAWSKVS